MLQCHQTGIFEWFLILFFSINQDTIIFPSDYWKTLFTGLTISILIPPLPPVCFQLSSTSKSSVSKRIMSFLAFNPLKLSAILWLIQYNIIWLPNHKIIHLLTLSKFAPGTVSVLVVLYEHQELSPFWTFALGIFSSWNVIPLRYLYPPCSKCLSSFHLYPVYKMAHTFSYLLLMSFWLYFSYTTFYH
jgi:hypothetical protein